MNHLLFAVLKGKSLMPDSIFQGTGKFSTCRMKIDLPDSPIGIVSDWGTQSTVNESVPENRLKKIAAILSGKSILSILDQGLVSGTTFITSVLIGRLCGQDILGIYFLAWSIIVFVRGVGDTIIGAPYMVFCQKFRGAALQAYRGSTFVQQLALAFTSFSILLFVILLLILQGTTVSTVSAAVSLLGALPILMIREHLRRLCLAHQDLNGVLFLDGLVAVIQIGSLLVLGYFYLLTVPVIYGVVTVACAIACCGLFFSGRYRFSMNRGQWLSDLRLNWSFARWALVTFLLGCSAPFIVPWLLNAVSGVSSTGLFAACMTIIGFCRVVVTGLTNLAVPRAAQALAEGGIIRLKQILPTTTIMFAGPCLVFCFAALFAGQSIVLFFYGTQFETAGPVVAVLSFWFLANTVGVVAGSSLWAMERPDANMVADILVIIVTLAATLYLVDSFGALGAAYGMLCGAVFGSVARWAAMFFLFHQSKPEKDCLHA
jgi:O-antigen/teichoic acid export membrane protein